MTSTSPMNSIMETQDISSEHSEAMASETAIPRHSDPENSDIGSRHTSPQLSQDISPHGTAERSIPYDGEHLDPDIHSRLWTPFFLLRSTLLAFIAFYLCIVAGLVALIVIDRRQQGLASAQTSQHYLWTYGPTAILTLVATLWGQVEYQTKQVMPWAVLRAGPTKASETLFIDYISINQTRAFFKSVRARHFPVAVAVLGSLLARLLVVVSTSLLVLDERPWVIKNIPVYSTEVFSSRDWNVTGFNAPFLYTIAMSLYNISHRPGTSKGQAVPNLDLQHLNLEDHDIIEVDLPIFEADSNCETARLISMTMREGREDPSQRKAIHIVAKTASSTIQHDLAWNLYKEWMNASADFHFMEDTQSDDWNQYIIFTGYMRPHTSEFRPYDAQATQQSNNNDSSILTILVCHPTYRITPLSIRIDTSQMLVSNTSSTHLPVPAEQLAHLSDREFFQGFHYALGGTGLNWYSILKMDGVGMEEVYSDRVIEDEDTVDDGLLTLLIPGRMHHIMSLLDPNVLGDAFKTLFQSAAAQMAKSKLLVSGSELYEATIHTTRKRLHVRRASVFSALGILAALTVISATLCVLAPRNTTSRSVESIGGFSTILSRSVDLSTYLCGTGCAQLATIQDSISFKWCKSHAGYANGSAYFGIDFYGDENSGELVQSEEDSSNSTEWWRPFAISAIIKALVLTLVIAIITTLEVLRHQSHTNNGLVEISNQGVVRYAWLYVPALVMMAIQILVGMISSISSVILPYHELRFWPSSGERTLFDKQCSLLTIHALYNSIYHRHWAIIATSISMLLSPFLTIAAAGLYTAETAPNTDAVQLRILDTLLSADTRNNWINYEIHDPGINKACFVSSLLITEENMVYPPWTLHGLVFPKIERLERDNSSNINDASTFLEGQSTITTRLSTLRPSLNCSLMAHDELNFTIHEAKLRGLSRELEQNVQLDVKYPGRCIAGNKTKTDVELQQLQIYLGKNGSRFGSVEDVQHHTGQPFCPSLMMVYGWSNDTSTVKVALCDGFVEELQVDTTFSLPSFDILDAQADEKTAYRVENGSASLGFLEEMAYLIPGSGVEHQEDFHPAFALIVRELDKQSLTWDDILGEKGFPHIVDRIQYLWRIVLPQFLNIRSRTEIQGKSPVVNGTLNRPNQYRLRQSDISTRILQVLLGVIGACVGICFWAMNTKEILPKNPCSIAAQASLLAGSSMLKEDVIPPGSEWCSDKELRERGVFEGLLFSMGWRGGADGEKRWFGIDVGKSDWSR